MQMLQIYIYYVIKINTISNKTHFLFKVVKLFNIKWLISCMIYLNS